MIGVKGRPRPLLHIWCSALLSDLLILLVGSLVISALNEKVSFKLLVAVDLFRVFFQHTVPVHV